MAVDLMHELGDIESGHGSIIEERISMLSLTADEFFSSKTTLKTYIDQINNNARLINEYTNNYKIATSKSEYVDVQNKINLILQNNATITLTIRSLITEQKDKICVSESSVDSIKVIEFNNLVETFRKTTLIFQQSLNTFDEAVCNKQMRQIHFLNDDLNDDEMERLNECNYEQRQQWIEKTMQLTDDQTLDRLVELEDQRDGMLRIERNIGELKELFEHLNILIVDQGMLIDEIEENVQYAGDQVEQATNHLNKAEKTQIKNRKMKCWCLVCLLMVIVIIVLWFVFKDQMF